jgi:hypothetical protein
MTKAGADAARQETRRREALERSIQTKMIVIRRERVFPSRTPFHLSLNRMGQNNFCEAAV